MRRFTVVFERDGDGWHASIPEVQGCHTCGPDLDETRRRIREALAVSLDDDDRDAIAEQAELVELVRNS